LGYPGKNKKITFSKDLKKPETISNMGKITDYIAIDLLA
jgi:hypothetical protein